MSFLSKRISSRAISRSNMKRAVERIERELTALIDCCPEVDQGGPLAVPPMMGKVWEDEARDAVRNALAKVRRLYL